MSCRTVLRRVKDCMGPTVLCALPKLPLGRALSHHKQEAGCIYVNNAGPWNAIMHLGYHGTEGPAKACAGLYNNAQSCLDFFRLKRDVRCTSVTIEVVMPSAFSNFSKRI